MPSDGEPKNPVLWTLVSNICLICSLVVLGALNKARSPSVDLNRLLCRISAYIVAASSKAIYAYVPTNTNPADLPSRLTDQPWQRTWEDTGA